jgi:uncharacterized membrane protein
MTLYLFLYVLSVVVCVGGMFFIYMCLRPVAAGVLGPVCLTSSSTGCSLL